MLNRKSSKRMICLVLSFFMAIQGFLIPTISDGRLFAEEIGEEFSPAEALSPGEYLQGITPMFGANVDEIEQHSYAQWLLLLTNALIMLDPKASDVVTLQQSITKTLNTIEKIRDFTYNFPKHVAKVEKVAGMGFAFFSKHGFPKSQAMFAKIQNAMAMLGNKQGLSTMQQSAKYMKSPYRQGSSACKQWFKKGTPLVDRTRSLSSLQTASMRVGSALQIMAGVMELSRFKQALGEDAGAPGFKTVQMGINGAILVATGLMALPPPGAWTVAAFAIIGAWEVIKQSLNFVGGKIEKWHKSYSDSINFLRETDEEFRAFYDHNLNGGSNSTGNAGEALIDPLERSSSLVFAQELRAALEKEPGEGEIAERQDKLVKNIEAQGILSTWYYQQAEAARRLPSDIKDLYIVWNHRADYMAWKPSKPKWTWNPIKLVGDSLAWAGDSIMEEVLGTEKQLKEDKKQYPEMALFCPDFALVILFRRFVTSKAQEDPGTDLPEILSLTGIRIEQSPFNYMPLIEIYDNNFNNWSDQILGQAFAADSLIVASKELPYLVEQLDFSNSSNETTTMLTFAKIMGIEVLGEQPKVSAHEMLLGLFKKALLKQLEGSARARAQYDALLEAYKEDPSASIKERKVEFDFNNHSGDFKLLEELFRGKRIMKRDLNFDLKMVSPEIWSGLLKDEELPEDAEDNAGYIFRKFAEPLQRNLQLNLNSTGISGVDMVRLGIQLKTELDILALAKDSLKDKKEALAEKNDVLTNGAIRAIFDKGEFLDVKRSWPTNFLSSFDPPIDLLKQSIEKMEKTVEKMEKSIKRRQKVVEKVHSLFKKEYKNWLITYRDYEDAADELGFNLTIRSSSNNYSPSHLDLIAPFVALDTAAD